MSGSLLESKNIDPQKPHGPNQVFENPDALAMSLFDIYAFAFSIPKLKVDGECRDSLM